MKQAKLCSFKKQQNTPKQGSIVQSLCQKVIMFYTTQLRQAKVLRRWVCKELAAGRVSGSWFLVLLFLPFCSFPCFTYFPLPYFIAKLSQKLRISANPEVHLPTVKTYLLSQAQHITAMSGLSRSLRDGSKMVTKQYVYCCSPACSWLASSAVCNCRRTTVLLFIIARETHSTAQHSSDSRQVSIALLTLSKWHNVCVV